MDEEKKIINTNAKKNEKDIPNKKAASNIKNKRQSSNLQEKKLNNHLLINSVNTNTSTKNNLIPTTDKNNISKTKKHNSIAFGSFQKKLNSNSSYKNLDYRRKTFNFKNAAGDNINLNPSSDTTAYFNANNVNNNSKLAKKDINNTINELNTNENSNMNNKEKEKEVFNLLNNTNATNPDQHIQRISVASGGNDLNINQVSLLESRNILSPNNGSTVNNYSHQNSINNISTSSDSNHIKVTVRFRPMNNVENVNKLS